MVATNGDQTVGWNEVLGARSQLLGPTETLPIALQYNKFYVTWCFLTEAYILLPDLYNGKIELFIKWARV